MQRLFLPAERFGGQTIQIDGADHLHLTRVLRAREGDALIVLDGRGNAYHAVLVSIDRSASVAKLAGVAEMPPEPPVFVTVAQALGKGDKFEQVVQHGTEAGASAFVPIRAERCVVDIPAARVAERLSRWRQIAKGAAEQSGRVIVPDVSAPLSFAQWLTQLQAEIAGGKAVVLLLHPDTSSSEVSSSDRSRNSSRDSSMDSSLEHSIDFSMDISTDARDDFSLHAIGKSRAIRKPEAGTLQDALAHIAVSTPIVLAVGPEGGWSPAEVSAAEKAKLLRVTLGPRILRTETAALVAISQIVYHFEFASV